MRHFVENDYYGVTKTSSWFLSRISAAIPLIPSWGIPWGNSVWGFHHKSLLWFPSHSLLNFIRFCYVFSRNSFCFSSFLRGSLQSLICCSLKNPFQKKFSQKEFQEDSHMKLLEELQWSYGFWRESNRHSRKCLKTKGKKRKGTTTSGMPSDNSSTSGGISKRFTWKISWILY